MKQFKKTYLLLLVMLLSSCMLKPIRQQTTKDWTTLKGGLYLSPNGELGFASDPEIANVDKSELEGERCPNVFISTFGYDQPTRLSELIDTATFEDLGASFYQDKSRIYNYYAMCDGGYFNIFSEDTDSFSVISPQYAQYKNEIYHFRTGHIAVDIASFILLSEYGLAKDKDGYISLGERISEADLEAEIGSASFKKLKLE
jgi:hypothetical protein